MFRFIKNVFGTSHKTLDLSHANTAGLPIGTKSNPKRAKTARTMSERMKLERILEKANKY
jgi:hypothetical protein